MKFLILNLVLLCLWGSAEARCKMRGECYQVGTFDKPCPVDIEPPVLVEDLDPEEAKEAIEILRNRCPTLAYDEYGNPLPDDEIRTCCDLTQLRGISQSLMLADSILGRCSICSRNFARQICEMNCSPDQGRFVDVYVEVGTNETQYVNEIDYRMHEDFMLGAHASCAGVIVPQTGMPAINIMCGNAAVCDAESWFGFTGDTSINPMAPVQVNFLRWTTEADSMNAEAPPCNATFMDDFPCSCVDCVDVCPTGGEPIVTEQCTVFPTVNCISFSVGLVFFVIVVMIFTALTVFEYRKSKRAEESKPTKSSENAMNRLFQCAFARIGEFSASNAVIMIMLTSWIAVGMIYGALNLRLTANPVELWSAPNSRSRMELEYFNSRFGPFYRAAQVFLRVKMDPFVVGNVTYGPAFRFEAVKELIELEDAIINIGRDTGGVVLEDVCYAPLRAAGSEPRLDQCVTMSVGTYFGNDRHNINNETYLTTIMNCLNNHFALNCLASWGGGAEPEITFGGYDSNITDATTLLINFPINNFLLEADLEPVLAWEQKFIDLMFDYEANKKPDFIDVSFGAERSIEDEIQRVSVAEAGTIAISYFIMFVYVTLALGNVRFWRTWLIDSKIVVAISSVLVVVISILCGMGMMGYLKITATLLAINVIPFFILSVGIDNVFLMVNTLNDIDGSLKEYEDYNENLSFEKKRRFVFSKMMSTVGPSMFVSSITQITCFAIGSLANFPAVRTFAVFASFSLGFLFIFQITTVVAILAIDYKRVSQNRFDVLCCIQKKILNEDDPLNSETPYRSVTKRMMGPYVDVLLKPGVKIFVIVMFATITSLSVIMIPSLEIGLDQELALPPDSYVYRYLQSVGQLMIIGPPVFFVLKSGLNFTDVTDQNAICGGILCNETSLATQIFLAAQHTDITYLAKSSNSWIDDFIDWASLPGSCCRYNVTDNSFCSSSDPSLDCDFCIVDRQEWARGLRPSPEAFEKYIPFFLRDPPTDLCNRAGLASYSASVNYVLDSEGRATVHDTNFMAYHSTLTTSKDYITAVKYAYEVSANITAAIKELTGKDVEVFPYSVFYVFYEQYLTMWADTFSSIGYCMVAAVVFYFLASGFNFLTTFAVMFTSLMVVLNMMGVMYIWNIPLNAVSNVNLIVSIGIAVEFCSHIGYAFTTSKMAPNEKVKDALQKVGSTIVTGITFTNIPIIVLAFSYTEIIEIFFFRMFFSLVILGFLHGMVFFPVLLSYLSK